MRIGIDIDCVCNNLVYEWIKRLNTTHELNIKYEDIKSYTIKKAFPMLTLEQIYKPFNDNNFWSSLLPVKDSVLYLKKLIDDGHDVKLITATDINYMLAKIDWVLKYYPYFNKNDVWMIFDKNWINADILLDDCIDNLEGGEYVAICYSQPWNENYTGLKVQNWKDFYKLVNIIDKDFKEVSF